ncbi:Cytochrome bd-I ubiquinol oxidase subunit 2 [Fundidesulfovibrio magnetotacticus]|uniref:Cytochrome bd-I ubiquinol oxidase subunit 2 n=1 Tax=Fundidesulfovibrio magnetotacticus TaxID=2730080 RepID=A0A6V8LN20_9BACT|nr:cytochrome d ubiquinol oxidase subunit II [Fundidesulfovibrio magnetotacticus]GFK92400.1 Cytochrome bd-I ubiquinol oxidase subunit 2 [Fundidesulfovibrio magnetotacticus]
MDLGTIWFLLWGVLWAVYFVLDGFDLGVGMLAPVLAGSDTEKRILLNSVGPFWDGNEVWLITAGGVTFAAFPGTYAVMFSALYTPLMLLLFALIFRGIAFEFRSKMETPAMRSLWDKIHFLGSFLPTLLLGVAFANIFQGVPIDKNGIFQGNLFTLLNPYGLAGGVLFVLAFLMHGALFLACKTENPIRDRAIRVAEKLWAALLAVAVLFLVFSAVATKLFLNYIENPLLFAVLALPVGGLLMQRVYIGQRRMLAAWTASAVTIAGVALFGVLGIYPALLPSSLDPAFSMTIANSASSPLTLKIMLTVALTFVPIVILYQAWVYKTFSHKVTEKDVDYHEAY